MSYIAPVAEQRFVLDHVVRIGELVEDSDLVDAITRVAAGGSAIDPVVIERLLRRSQTSSDLSALTERERDVLAGMAEGRSNSAIGSSGSRAITCAGSSSTSSKAVRRVSCRRTISFTLACNAARSNLPTRRAAAKIL